MDFAQGQIIFLKVVKTASNVQLTGGSDVSLKNVLHIDGDNLVEAFKDGGNAVNVFSVCTNFIHITSSCCLKKL